MGLGVALVANKMAFAPQILTDQNSVTHYKSE